MMPQARIGDQCTHGAIVITGSSTRTADGVSCARLGDMVLCPLHGHGLNPIIACVAMDTSDGQSNATVMAIAQCGAIIITGSPDVASG